MWVQDYLSDVSDEAARNLFNRTLRRTDPKRSRRWPAVETLESRVLLSVFPLTGSSGNTITGGEGSSTGTVLLGGFTDGNPASAIADFTSGGGSVVVNWGDGAAPQTLSASNLTFIGVAGAGEWTINAAHTYTEDGTYAYTNTVTDADGAATIVSGSAIITDAPLTSGVPTLLTANKGIALPGTTLVGKFFDSNNFATTTDFTDQVDWGDGSPESTGIIVATATPGEFDVEAGHTYTKIGTFTTLITVHDTGGSQVIVAGSATATLPTPEINTTQLPANGTVLVTSLSDSVTLTGGNKVTGTVTFNLYNNASASGTPLFTDTETLSGGTATSKGYFATAVGTDYWVDTYNGNARNNPVTSSAAAEPVVVSPALPTFSSLSDETIIIHSAHQAFTGTIAAGSLIPPGNVIVTLNGVQKTAVINSNGNFSVTFSTGSLPVGEYTVEYNYVGSADFLAVIDTSELDVTYGITPSFKNVKYKSGTTIPIAVGLTDAAGNDVNTTATTVVTTGLARASTPGTLIPGVDVGLTFTPDSDGDLFSLSLHTTGLAAGTYVLYFTITGDPVPHDVTFMIKK